MENKIVSKKIQSKINEIQKNRVKIFIQSSETINVLENMQNLKNIEKNYINGVCASYSAYSSYLNKNISRKSINTATNSDEYSYKPIIFYIDDYLIEFRINSNIQINVYDLENNKIQKILFEEETIPSTLALFVEENYEQKLRKLLLESEQKKENNDDIVELCCVIPQEYNIGKALKNEIVINRLKNIGIDVEIFNFSNTIIFVDGIPVKCYQEKFYEIPITDILLKENLQLLLAENSEKNKQMKQYNDFEKNIVNDRDIEKQNIDNLINKTLEANVNNDFGIPNYLNQTDKNEMERNKENNLHDKNEIDKEVN